MRLKKILLVPFRCGIHARCSVCRGCALLRGLRKGLSALIWLAVVAATTTAWAEATPNNARTAPHPGQRQVLSTVSDPSPRAQTGSTVAQDAPEAGADRFFRAYMLPGAVLLVLMIAAALTAIFWWSTPGPASSARPISQAIETLNPAYFALVMSTGIVSIAARYQGFNAIAAALFGFNVVAYAVLWIMYIGRIVFFTARFRDDFRNHMLGMGFFTTVAASGVLGSQTLLLTGRFQAAAALWCVTIALWICLIYGLFTGLITKEIKPTIAEGINGGWLLAIVATQAVCVLSTAIAPFFELYREPMLFLAFITWLFGGMLYIWVISLIFYRYLFFHFSPQDLTPPYWINMGAVAITTLGGTGLIANAASSPLLLELTPFLKGFTFFFWATATWWIPMLVILGVWRHGYRRFPLRYNPLFWGAVFPLGMYTACTHRLAEVTAAPLIAAIPKGFVYVAMTAWIVTFAGMVHGILASVRGAKSSTEQ